jgi:hypothetical protein
MQGGVEHGQGAWRDWRAAVLLLVASVIALGAVSVQPRADEATVAVLFPPWWSPPAVFGAAAAAGADVIRATAIPSLLVLRPAADRDGWARLRAAGAWLALDPKAVAACFGA